jgi:hypothetical protein
MIHPIFIGKDSCELIVEGYVNWIFIFLRELLFQFTVFLQPFALVMLGSKDIIVAYVDLERVFVFKLDRFVN